MNQAQSEGQRSRATILWTRCALLGIVVFFIGVGWLGSDFGRHWDEHWMVAAWVETIEEEAYRSPRPYPGFYYDLTLPSLAWLSVQSPNREALLSQVQSPDFLISVRHQFVVFSAVAILVAFTLIRRLRRPEAEALLGAAVVGFSWQFSYHSRWVASDALLAVLVPASVCLALEAWRRPDRSRLWLGAAILAGMAMATKYPGGLALLPVLWVSARAPFVANSRQSVGLRVGASLGVFGATFLFFSPHVWLDLEQALGDLEGMMAQYATGHLGHTVEPGLQHAFQIGGYLLEILSPNPGIATGLATLALLGVAALLRLRPRETALVFAVPLAYWAYFSTQHVLIIRNLLVLTPFLAALVGVGAGVLCGWPSTAVRRRVLWAGVWSLCALNALWTLQSARSIADYDLRASLVSLVRTIEAEPDRPFRVSKQIAGQWREEGLEPRTKNWRPVAPDAVVDPRVQVAVLSRQYPVMWFPWPANERGRYQDLGPQEIDWDFYPGWTGPNRVILMSGSVWDEVRTPRASEATP